MSTATSREYVTKVAVLGYDFKLVITNEHLPDLYSNNLPCNDQASGGRLLQQALDSCKTSESFNSLSHVSMQAFFTIPDFHV